MKRISLLGACAITLVVGCAASSQSAPVPAAPAASGAPAVTAHLREERATATVDRLAAKDFEGAREFFDRTMREQLSAQLMRDTWSQAEGQFGPYKSRSFNGAMRVKGYVTLEYDLAFEKAHATAQVIFDDDGLVGGLYLRP